MKGLTVLKASGKFPAMYIEFLIYFESADTSVLFVFSEN